MRLAMYAGASAALAASVVTSAFYQRANFYSAMVYLSQSNLCLMILVNLIFLVYGSFMYGLQRLCFGALRPVEVEQLYEKAWFAVTETCLAMTVFREEVGAFFLVMFTALITGKVWGWIGEGRVEVFEQQPPANPRLFHTRLVISLVTSVAFNIWLLIYSIDTVIATAKPTMMVMFLFEFAVLTVGSLHTGLRYVISLVEASVIKKQTKQRLEQRRNEVRQEREDILRRRAAGELAEGEGEPLPDPDEVEEFDIEVPGWDSKGQWVLFLDLFAGKPITLSDTVEAVTDAVLGRLPQALRLHCLLLRPSHFLRPADPHHAGSLHDYKKFCQAAERSYEIQTGTSGYEPISGCHGGRPGTRGHLHYLPRGDASLGPQRRSARKAPTQKATLWTHFAFRLSQELAREATSLSDVPKLCCGRSATEKRQLSTQNGLSHRS